MRGWTTSYVKKIKKFNKNVLVFSYLQLLNKKRALNKIEVLVIT